MQAALAGEPAARASLADRWAPAFFRFCLRMMGSREDAQDVAQDALVKLLRALPQYDPSRPFPTWAFQIARNTCIDELRRRRRSLWELEEAEAVPDGAPGPLAQVSAVELAVHLEAAIQALSPMYREIIVLYHFEHLKYGEIAEVLDLPMGTVMNRIFRARQRLRVILENKGVTP